MGKHSMLIKVRENEFKPILDRDRVVADIEKNLKPWIDLLSDVTNYGSNLIPRCFSSSKRSLKDVVVLAILLRQVVAMLDGVEILLSRGASHAANPQMRALFEASVFIAWILEGDSEKKAIYYYVHNLRRKRLWASRTQPNSAESQEFIAMMNNVGVKISDEITESGAQQVRDIDRVLSQPRLAEVNKDFETQHKRRTFDPAWYVPLGLHSFRAVARAVNQVPLYTILYSGASEVMHASSYEHHVIIGKGEITFQPIRSMEGFANVLHFSITIAFSTFRRILAEYRAEELPAFSRKYKENWQRDFMNFPRITYETKTTNI